MYVYMYIYIYINLYIYIYNMFVYTRIYIYVHKHIKVYICIYIHIKVSSEPTLAAQSNVIQCSWQIKIMQETQARAHKEVSTIFGLFCEYVGLFPGNAGLFCDRALLQRHTLDNQS